MTTTVEMLEGYEPSTLGLDDWSEYRRDPVTGAEIQLEVIEFAAYCDKRFAAVCAPTGIGKTLAAISIAKVTMARTVILTATKGLQEQYQRDFRKYGLVDIRGKSNYDCVEYENLDCMGGQSMNCDAAKNGGCTYTWAKSIARESQMVSANYAYWFNVNDKAQGLKRTPTEAALEGDNPVELLILDEGHEAVELLSDYLAVRVYENEIKELIDTKILGDDITEWKRFVVQHITSLEVKVVALQSELGKLGRRVQKHRVSELHQLERLVTKFKRIVDMVPADWVCDIWKGTKFGRVWAFDIIWPGRYAEKYLFCGVPKVVVMSATLRKKTMGLLGVSQDKYEFREWRRIFSAARNPIYSIPPKLNGKEVRVSAKSSNEAMFAWVDWIDQIIDGRLDRKGLIQTVSYDRQRFLMDHSRHTRLMIGNTNEPDTPNAIEKAEEFRVAKPPALLVSPSFGTGYDFPGDQCEYIVICKVPFKPMVSKVSKARNTNDPQYSLYQTMIELIQSAGRGMRFDLDRCEVFITDGNLGWFMAQNGVLAPHWFSTGIRKVSCIPVAPEKL